MSIPRTWTNLKDSKTSPGVWGYDENAKSYKVFRDDGKRKYKTLLPKDEYNVAGTDTKDFYDNYKPGIDAGQYSIETRTVDNKLIMHDTDRDKGLMYNFASFFDNTGIHDGQAMEIIFNSGDSSPKSVEGTFGQELKITESIMFYENMPSGSKAVVEIFCPNNGFYGKDSATDKPCAPDHKNFVLAQNLTGDWLKVAEPISIITYGTDNHGHKYTLKDPNSLPQGYKIKMSLYSGDTGKNCRMWMQIKNEREHLV